MGAKLTTDGDIATSDKPGCAKSRRKIILNTPSRSKSEVRPVPASRPRKRNALGVARMAKMLPKAAKASQSRPVVISKSQNHDACDKVETAWGMDDRNRPDEKETSRNSRRMLVAILVATLMLGVFNSSALVNRVRSLPAGPVEDYIINIAETWHGWVEDRGLSGYIDVARAYVASLKEKRWQDLKR